VRFEVLTAVVMNVAFLCDIAPCSPYVNRRFRRTSLHVWTPQRYIPEHKNMN
jgi:hypothetical protein